MNKRWRIPLGMVEKYKDEICFLVDTSICILQPVVPRTFWIPTMDYGICEDEIEKHEKVLLSKPIDQTEKSFGTYEEAGSIIKFELKKPIIEIKIRKMITRLEAKFGEEISTSQEVLEAPSTLSTQPVEATTTTPKKKYKRKEMQQAKGTPTKISPLMPTRRKPKREAKGNKSSSARQKDKLSNDDGEDTPSDKEVKEVKEASKTS